MHPDSRALLLALAWAGVASAALAQTAPAPGSPAAASAAKSTAAKSTAAKTAAAKPATDKPTRHKFNPYQSPLATVMQFRLHAEVPEAQDFVKETRPDKATLKYTPLQSQLGPEPVRPKPRDAAGIDALKAEMEASIAHNEARVAGKSKGKAHRAKPDAAGN